MHINRLLPSFVLFAVVGATCDAAIVELRDQATITQRGMIELGDVAQVSDADPLIVQRLQQITLSPAPLAGRSVRLSFEDIRSRMQAQGVNLAEIEFRGQLSTEVHNGSDSVSPRAESRPSEPPAPLKVRSRSRQIPPSKFEEAKAQEILSTAFRRAFRTGALESQGWRVRCEAESEHARRVAALYPEEIHFRESQIVPGAPQMVTAWWENSQGEIIETIVQVTIEQTPQVLSVKQNLPMGAILRPDDLAWVAAPDHTSGLTRVADVIGKQTSRTVRAGQPLQMGDLTTVPLIRSNDIVTVTVRQGGVTVRRSFKALSAGGLDETVNLSAIDDPRIRIQAVVTGYHEASLSPAPELSRREAPSRNRLTESPAPISLSRAGVAQ
ncbi:MAG: flagellar basal body P-ring formation chaperone FlgA [Planctomycetaceae bacterium]|nr:flagellar basal body P-ring formation chaperone FlgA [Planctomycetaceae bacterium]